MKMAAKLCVFVMNMTNRRAVVGVAAVSKHRNCCTSRFADQLFVFYPYTARICEK